jgi:hypothetical protein
MEHNVWELATQADHILNIHDVSNIWHVPLLLRDQKGHIAIFSKLNLSSVPPPALESWATRAARCDNLSVPVRSWYRLSWNPFLYQPTDALKLEFYHGWMGS